MTDDALPANGKRRAWIIEARNRRGWSQTQLANLVGCSQNELSKIETGHRRRIDPRIAEAIAKHLGMTREQVMFEDSNSRQIKIRGEVLADETISMFASEENLQIDWLSGGHIEGYRITVDALEPRFYKGEILLCRTTNTILEECYGAECIVEFEGQRFVKHVERGASIRVVTLRSYRAANPTLIDITPTWITPIFAIALTERQRFPRSMREASRARSRNAIVGNAKQA
jgi:transcriptional regulator with XRE-family HTH domain